MSLEDYGYGPFFSRAFDAYPSMELEPARVVFSGSPCQLVTATEPARATLSGRARLEEPRPAVGDWVAYDRSREHIRHVLPRRSKLSRKVAGRRTEEQVLAANVDTVLIVMGLDSDFNPRRLERYLTTVWESGASPVVLLNKADLGSGRSRVEVDEAAGVAPVIEISALTGEGVEALAGYLRARETSILVGSSGAGKSTLINRLLGREAQRTSGVRESDERGRHTTSHRELFVLPGGALLIDSPGIREVALWSEAGRLERAFEDIGEWAEACRFRDCTHQSEPGCAVRDAVGSGVLSESRLESFRALQKELRYLETRQSESAQQVQKQKWRAIHREMRRSGRHRRT